MSQCDRCGSYAINHHCHGRDGSDGDLCDVCYWRKRAERQPLTDELLKLLEQIYWIMKDDMPVELRSECFNTLDRCGVNV